jgi:hypothetical protein
MDDEGAGIGDRSGNNGFFYGGGFRDRIGTGDDGGAAE